MHTNKYNDEIMKMIHLKDIMKLMTSTKLMIMKPQTMNNDENVENKENDDIPKNNENEKYEHDQQMQVMRIMNMKK